MASRAQRNLAWFLGRMEALLGQQPGGQAAGFCVG
jgi:hypothetical protein